MPTTTEPTGDELEGALPRFDPVEDDETEDPAPPPPPAAPTPPQASSTPPPPQAASAPTTGTSSSSTASSERTVTLEDLTDAIGDVAGQLFKSCAEWMNRRERRRRNVVTARWLATDDEVVAIGQLAEDYLVKQVPDTVKSSEGASAAVVGGLVIAGYAIRNLIGGDESAEVPRPQAPPPAPRPVAAAPAQAAPPPPAQATTRPAPAVLQGADNGVAPPEGAPLDVISPAI